LCWLGDSGIVKTGSNTFSTTLGARRRDLAVRLGMAGRVSMRSALRSILAVVAGFVVASTVMTLVEMANGRILYPELGKLAQGVTDREVIRALFAQAPVGALLVVLAGWVLGSLAGGFVAAWIGRSSPVGHAVAVGGCLTLAGIANNLMLPPPLWFWVAGLVLLVPAAVAAAQLAPRPSH
jgi:hypothetical protein